MCYFVIFSLAQFFYLRIRIETQIDARIQKACKLVNYIVFTSKK